jgi:hypothetical protein
MTAYPSYCIHNPQIAIDDTSRHAIDEPMVGGWLTNINTSTVPIRSTVSVFKPVDFRGTSVPLCSPNNVNQVGDRLPRT